jgi:hypothetical protein
LAETAQKDQAPKLMQPDGGLAAYSSVVLAHLVPLITTWNLSQTAVEYYLQY